MSTHGSLSEVERFNLLYKSSFNKVCNFACFYVRNKQANINRWIISKHKYDGKIPKMILYNGNSAN